MKPPITDIPTANRANLAKTALPRPRWEKLLDYGISIVGLALLLPVIFVAIVLTKIVSRGPALFKQRRIGYMGKPFMIYKLRTMMVDADTETHENHTLDLIKSNRPMTKMDKVGDARLIPLGCFLRTSGIDELPQLINVLKGEMSLVGPRPCLISEYEAFSESDRRRFDTMPGITGLWQVSGKNALTFREMIDCDIQYALRKTLPLYLKIAIQTPFVLTKQVWECRKNPSLANVSSSDGPLESYRKVAS